MAGPTSSDQPSDSRDPHVGDHGSDSRSPQPQPQPPQPQPQSTSSPPPTSAVVPQSETSIPEQLVAEPVINYQPPTPLESSPDDPTSPKLKNQYSFPTVATGIEEEFDEKHPYDAARPSRLDSVRTANLDRASLDIRSASSNRADVHRLDDDMELLRAERFVSNQENERLSRSRTRNHVTELEDAFNPTASEEPKIVKQKDKNAPMYKVFAFLRKFPRIVRYLVYLIPGAILLLIPILLGALAIDENAHPVGGYGGTPLMWFGIWLEVIWASLWVSRMVTSLMPPLFHGIAKIFGSTSARKWRDIGAQLDLHTAGFLWMLAVLVSFKPLCSGHSTSVEKGHEDDVDRQWIGIVFKVLIALFVLATLNWVEKILIQWIATAFHERTYATRILNNKGDIQQLVQLFEYAKAQLQETDEFWHGSGTQSTLDGAQTPMRAFQGALQDNARHVVGKIGQVAGRVGNDLIGRKTNSNHPRKVVGELLRTTSSSHSLARLIYRALVSPEKEMVFPDDMQKAFTTPEEADAAFNMFDKDLNGDISVEEFEAVTNEISLEKKSIAASLKDLDSVIQKLDKVFLFIIFIITIVIFISIISSSAAAGLTSAGSTILALSWMLQATAQEFLQSIIFVFIKHPFDVGDRVTIYGSTGATLTGDDYYVTEISLLYTEFKKLQGHVVQAPNSLLNTLFILNQRRSNGIADPITLQIRFGTPAWMIDELKARMLDFCANNKREYQHTILTEIAKITDMRAATLTVVYIHKSNFQNELMRLARSHKFMTELMAQMYDIGIQSPYRVDPGGSREHPLHYAGPPPAYINQVDQDAMPPAFPGQQPAPGAPKVSGSVRRPSMTSASSNRHNLGSPTGDAVDFQDVFENRREHFIATRLASIREKNHAEKAHEEAIKEAESEPRASTSALESVGSHTSAAHARSRIFGRGRSTSKAAQRPPGAEQV